MNLQSFFLNKRVASTKPEIISVGTFLPEQRVKSEDLFDSFSSELKYGISRDWMSSYMGITERRFSDSKMNPSDLAIAAAEKAINNADWVNKDDIDLIIFCGIERDQPEPATAHRVQKALGLKAKHTFDVANACIGFVDGMEIANKFIESGTTNYALVVTGETTSRVAQSSIEKLNKGMPLKDARNKLGFLSVGDAGGAVIIGKSFYTNRGFQLFNTDVDSNHIDKCIYKHTEDGIDAQMIMGKILAQGIKMHRNMIPQTLNMLGWDSFDHILSHQTGRRNFKEFSKFDGISIDKMVKTYPLLGNTTTATFPLSWEKLLNSGRLKSGDRIGGLFAGSGLATCQFGLLY